VPEYEKFDGRCLTCRETVTVTKGTYREMRNKRGSLYGPCPVCKKTVFKIVQLRKKTRRSA
jgi:hypothetical protein